MGNLELFKFSFSTFWLDEPKFTEDYPKSPRFVAFGANLTQFDPTLTSLGRMFRTGEIETVLNYGLKRFILDLSGMK